MYKYVNDEGNIEFDNREAVRLAKETRVEGFRLQIEVLPYLFSEMTDSDLAAFSGQAGELSQTIEGWLRDLRAAWNTKLAALDAWRDFNGIIQNVVLLLDGCDAAAWVELDRRFDEQRVERSERGYDACPGR